MRGSGQADIASRFGRSAFSCPDSSPGTIHRQRLAANAAEYLRVESPSAEVQGHGPGQKVLVAGRRHVGIADVETVGNYAIRIIFDDLHDTGIFSWRYLHQLGAEHEMRWPEFVTALEAAGLSRDP